jgi:hypothetical protein
MPTRKIPAMVAEIEQLKAQLADAYAEIARLKNELESAIQPCCCVCGGGILIGEDIRIGRRRYHKQCMVGLNNDIKI